MRPLEKPASAHHGQRRVPRPFGFHERANPRLKGCQPATAPKGQAKQISVRDLLMTEPSDAPVGAPIVRDRRSAHAAGPVGLDVGPVVIAQ